MNSIVVAEIVTAVSVLLSLVSLILEKDKSRSTNKLFICSFLTLAWLLVDSLSYYLTGPKTPAPIIYTINLLAYLFGSGVLIGFFSYCKTYMMSKTNIHPGHFDIPKVILVLNIIMITVIFALGKIIIVEDGVLKVVGTLPVYIYAVYIVLLLYIPLLAFLKRRDLGAKSVFMMAFYGIVAISTIALDLALDKETSVITGSFAIILVVTFMQRSDEKERLMAMNSQLSKTNSQLQKLNDEQEIHIDKIANLNGQLRENQEVLEKASIQQQKQFLEIQRLNQLFKDTQDHAIRQLLSDMINKKHESVDSLMECIGEYFDADRAFVFEISNDKAYMENTMQWCRDCVESTQFLYQKTPAEMLYALTNDFMDKGAIHIVCDDAYHEVNYRMYTFLTQHNVQEMMAAPMLLGGEIVGFMGISNPRVHQEQELFLTIGATLIQHEIQIEREHLQEEKYQHELEETTAKAKAASNAKTSFLFNMSHDIRTPMNAIIGFRELLEKNQEDPKKRQYYIDKIEESSTVLLSILNNVLEMSRIEKGTIELEEHPWASEQFADSVYSIFKELTQSKGITFEKEVSFIHPYVLCDPTKLREIFMNILSNAYKYTNPGGKITMKVEELPHEEEGMLYYKTEIEDTGVGMSEDFLPHLFEEFSRENNSAANKIEGTGLGMPIVKRLVDLMGGTIEVTSKKNVGTKVTMIIPHKIIQREDIKNKEKVHIDLDIFEGKRILLAEDNDINAEIAMDILIELGFTVERVADGDLCVKKIMEVSEGYYDLILMDIQMPNMNGYDATRAIRRLHDSTKAMIPIVAMTANAFEEDKKNARKAGMNGHIAKPIQIHDMLYELASVLAK